MIFHSKSELQHILGFAKVNQLKIIYKYHKLELIKIILNCVSNFLINKIFYFIVACFHFNVLYSNCIVHFAIAKFVTSRFWMRNPQNLSDH